MQTGNLGAMRFTSRGAWVPQLYSENSVVRVGNAIYASNRKTTPENVPGQSDGWDLWLANSSYLGQFMFTSFIEEELPEWMPGWYVRDGRYYPNDTVQAIMLNRFPAGFKQRHGIINDGLATCMPTAFHVDGRGLFERAVNGATRSVDSIEDDAMQVLEGGTGLPILDGFELPAGVFHRNTNSWTDGVSLGPGPSRFLVFDNRLVARTAAENRSLNLGLLPIMKLEV